MANPDADPTRANVALTVDGVVRLHQRGIGSVYVLAENIAYTVMASGAWWWARAAVTSGFHIGPVDSPGQRDGNDTQADLSEGTCLRGEGAQLRACGSMYTRAA